MVQNLLIWISLVLRSVSTRDHVLYKCSVDGGKEDFSGCFKGFLRCRLESDVTYNNVYVELC